jgi:cephalosporin-C deacetylase-like acetyl esterase
MTTLLLLLCAVAPPVRSATDVGDRILAESFRQRAGAIRERALHEVRDAAGWLKNQAQRRRELLAMLALDPLPERTPLRATVTGTLDTPHFRVEKLHFQSAPGLYVTANLYRPLKVEKPLPAVLYVCGHSPQVKDGVSYGNKVAYQHHGAWFAENGYVCLVVDTLQLGELQGLHHGTHRLGMWWWQSLGYTPAGIELWNAIRAIDYLETRPEVDRKRIGVTGRSGGGATSWWVMAADERVACAVPVAGLADMLAHVSEGSPGRPGRGVIGGHCDCMYFVNTHRWDFVQVMALCAPRPVLLGNSDADPIFPVPGYRRPAEPIARLYKELGVPEKFGLLETKGGHTDTPELRRGAFAWMNRWLKNDTNPITLPERERLTHQQLQVFAKPPVDAINDIVHERFLRPATHPIPGSVEVARVWWPGKKEQLLETLRTRLLTEGGEKRDALNVQPQKHTIEGFNVTTIDFTSEQGVPLRAWLLAVGEPKEVIASICDEAEWSRWVSDLGPAFADVLYKKGNPAPHPYPVARPERLDTLRRSMKAGCYAFALVAPRGVGPTRFSDREPQHLRRRYALLGTTLETQQIADIRRALTALPVGKAKLTLQAQGDAAVLAISAGLMEPRVARLELTRPTTTHRSGPAMLGVLRVLDVSQAIALLEPREVILRTDKSEWPWLEMWQRQLGNRTLIFRGDD